MNELGAALQWLLDAFETWLQCVARPVPTLNRILLEATDDEQLSAAGKVWAPSQLITLIISFPILKLYGIEWNDLGYHLCNWLTTIVVLIIFAFTAHKLLLALQLKSQFVQTLVIYTVIVTTYSPITTLLSIPSTLTLFAAVQNFKQHPIAIDKAVMVYFSSFSNTTSFYANTIGVLSIFTQVFSFRIKLCSPSACRSGIGTTGSNAIRPSLFPCSCQFSSSCWSRPRCSFSSSMRS